MDLIADVVAEWGWCGIVPKKILDTNALGNLLIEDEQGVVWRLCPEDIYCKPIADSQSELARLRESEEFSQDWSMVALVLAARQKHGEPGENRCYCLKVPGVLGGEYHVNNIGTVPVDELVRFSGDLGRQIKDLPDGARVELRVID